MVKKINKLSGIIKTKEGVINYDETLFQQRKLFLYDIVSGLMVEELSKQLLVLESINHNPIELYINSPGGSVDDGFAFIDLIKNSKCKIITIAQGCVASMATLIFITGKHRKSYKSSSLMLHDMASGMSDYSAKMEARMDFQKKQWKQLSDYIRDNTKLTDKDIEYMRSGELWFTATEAKEKGLVDEII